MAERFLLSVALGDVAQARGWACEQVAGFSWPTRWRLRDADVSLVVSELLSNALQHAGGLVGLVLVFDARRLRIMVSDGSHDLPVLRSNPAGGWGLVIVDRLADAWGVAPYRNGKQVWADLAAAGLPRHRRPQVSRCACRPSVRNV